MDTDTTAAMAAPAGQRYHPPHWAAHCTRWGGAQAGSHLEAPPTPATTPEQPGWCPLSAGGLAAGTAGGCGAALPDTATRQHNTGLGHTLPSVTSDRQQMGKLPEGNNTASHRVLAPLHKRGRMRLPCHCCGQPLAEHRATRVGAGATPQT